MYRTKPRSASLGSPVLVQGAFQAGVLDLDVSLVGDQPVAVLVAGGLGYGSRRQRWFAMGDGATRR